MCIRDRNRPVRVYETEEAAEGDDPAHLTLVNLPAEITAAEGQVEVAFAAGGYMEAETSVPAATASAGWETRPGVNGGTRFIKYGAADTLVIEYGE